MCESGACLRTTSDGGEGCWLILNLKRSEDEIESGATAGGSGEGDTASCSQDLAAIRSRSTACGHVAEPDLLFSHSSHPLFIVAKCSPYASVRIFAACSLMSTRRDWKSHF